MSPGTKSRDLDARRSAFAHTVTDGGSVVHRLGGPFGPVLVREPKPTDSSDDHADDDGIAPSPTNADTTAAASSSHRSGLLTCRNNTDITLV